MVWTPMSASAFSSPATFPSLIIWRCGQVWLPMGSPSGLAANSAAPATRNPATAASVAVFRRNSRRDRSAMRTPLPSKSLSRRSSRRIRASRGGYPLTNRHRMPVTMIRICASLLVLLMSQPATQPRPLRIIAFGAHPDDAEQKTGGIAALWASRGYKVKFVAMTNGDVGHFEMAGGPLAKRRKAEVSECARIFGIETEVLDIHDGELMPSLENRKTVARLIREWQADIVLSHRPNDYHPDHRYLGVLADDAAILVMAPFFVPDTAPTARNPAFLHYSDDFQRPYPFKADVVVSIDETAEKKWICVTAMPSQFGDKDSWQGRTRPDVPPGDRERQAYLLELVKQRTAAVADRYRDRLVAMYGDARGKAVKYAEAFELCEYGRQPAAEELRKMFVP